jgi:hypothetical protein
MRKASEQVCFGSLLCPPLSLRDWVILSPLLQTGRWLSLPLLTSITFERSSPPLFAALVKGGRRIQYGVGTVETYLLEVSDENVWVVSKRTYQLTLGVKVKIACFDIEHSYARTQKDGNPLVAAAG